MFIYAPPLSVSPVPKTEKTVQSPQSNSTPEVKKSKFYTVFTQFNSGYFSLLALLKRRLNLRRYFYFGYIANKRCQIPPIDKESDESWDIFII